MLKVFLSSTFRDLISERQAVEAAIQRMAAQYIGMEHFGSFAEEPLDRCLDKVRSADVMILVLGHKYGFVPDGSSISMTEAEYREARDKGIPVLCYLISEDFLFPLSDADPRLIKLKESIKSKHGISRFTSPEDLAWKVVSDLAREFSSYLSAETSSIEVLGNQILIDPVKDRIDELVAILEDRAQRINRELHKYYNYAPVEKYLSQFQDLHKRHINSLREGRVMRAHEILSEIHRLSFELARDEFWTRHRVLTPNVQYRLRFDAFQRGELICEYVGGEMKAYSEEYPSDEGFPTGFRRNDTVAPTVSVKLYEKILSRKQTNNVG